MTPCLGRWHRIARGIVVSGLALMPVGSVVSALEPGKAAALLEGACNSLGGNARFAALKHLEMESDLRSPDGTVVDLRIAIELPDRMTKAETIHLSRGPTVSRIASLRGQTASLRPGSEGVPLAITMSPADEDALARRMRDELLRYAVAFLCAAPRSLGLEARYAGRAEAPDGTAHVLAIAGPTGEVARLFLDETSSRPLMLSYTGSANRSGSRKSPAAATKSGVRPAPSPALPAEPKPQHSAETVEWRVGDYRSVNGLQLPHHVTISAAGAITEEWTVRRFRVAESQ
jgi:hypothetical protein